MGRIKKGSNTAKARGRAFLQGPDSRRNTKGQTSGEQVALTALLKKFLADEGLKVDAKTKQTKAEALAGVIWRRALLGHFPYVQFLFDRILGKVSDRLDLNVEGEQPDNKLIVQVVHSYMGEGGKVDRKTVVEHEYGGCDYNISTLEAARQRGREMEIESEGNPDLSNKEFSPAPEKGRVLCLRKKL